MTPTPHASALATTEQRLKKGRVVWPSLLLLLVAAAFVASPNKPRAPTVRALAAPGDTAVYRASWAAPIVDALHPAATFYHWQLVLGDTAPHQPLTGYPASGVTWGYANAQQYGYQAGTVDTFRVVRPLVDSTGPFRYAVQAAVGGTTTATPFTLGAYALSAPFYVRAKQLAPNPPGAPVVDSIGFSLAPGETLLHIVLRNKELRRWGTPPHDSVQYQLCAFGVTSAGRKIVVSGWGKPLCTDTLFRSWLAEVPA